MNVIIEMLSNVNLSNDLQLLGFGGRVMVSTLCLFHILSNYYIVLSFKIVGSRGPIEINPRDTMMKETSIIGVALYNATKVLWASCVVSCFLVFVILMNLLLTFD